MPKTKKKPPGALLAEIRWNKATKAERVEHGRIMNAGRIKRTHCLRGHLFTPENTYTTLDGAHRQCRSCNKLRAKGVDNLA